MVKRIPIILISSIMIIVFLLIVLFLTYHLHGSLEDFPTDEQQEKVQMVTSAVIFVLAAIEGVLYMLIRAYLKRINHKG